MKGGRAMTRKELKEFFARRDEVWQRHDFEALTVDHAEDCVVESPFSGRLEGHGPIKKVYREWFISFPDSAYVTQQLLIDRNKVAQFVKMTGTQEGDFCGLAPTGKRFEVRCVFYFSFADSKITQEIRIYDLTSVYMQLGILKAKPSF